MTLTDNISFISTAIKSNTTLNSLGLKFRLGTPTEFPSITMDGLVCTDDKQGRWTANLNLWIKDTPSLNSFSLAQTLLAAISTGPILTSGFLYRPEPQEGLERYLYPITLFIK